MGRKKKEAPQKADKPVIVEEPSVDEIAPETPQTEEVPATNPDAEADKAPEAGESKETKETEVAEKVKSPKKTPMEQADAEYYAKMLRWRRLGRR